MLRTSNSGKTSVIGLIVACVCILAYLGALVSLIVRVNSSMEQRRIVADQEFYDLADLASSAGAAGFFMDETFVEIIQNALDASSTIEGVIISGPNGGYAFEKGQENGRSIYWVNSSNPRFKNRFDFSRQPLYQPLRIQGLRNTNIEARAGAFDYAELSEILKQALLLVASALLLAFIALLLVSLRKGHGLNLGGAKLKAATAKQSAAKAATGKATGKASGTAAGKASGTASDQGATAKTSTERYSQRSRVIREENTELRITEELHRCAAAGYDLALLVMEYKPAGDDSFYARFAADAARFFSSRDFVCEKGKQGISVICSGLSLDAGFLNADEFHSRIMSKYPSVFKQQTDICMGISCTSGRPVNAERLIFEAEEALERALMDPISHIVAFKSDPQKYREFMESQSS